MAASRTANPWLDRGVFHWAHQGGAKEAPSNTLCAMELGRENQADGLEFDVHRSRDGVVLIHDPSLHRTTNRSGWVADHSADELAEMDAAYWWVKGEVDNHDSKTPQASYERRGEVDKDRDLGIPTLDDLLDRFRDMPMTIEVKDSRATEPLVAALRNKEIPFENLIVTSFSDEIVEELHTLAPDLPLAPGERWTFKFYLWTRLFWPAPKAGPFVALQVPYKLPLNKITKIPAPIRGLLPSALKLKVTSRRLIRRAHRRGLAVHVWTIDDHDEMCTLIDMGVDGIMTDRPSELTAIFAERRPARR